MRHIYLSSAIESRFSLEKVASMFSFCIFRILSLLPSKLVKVLRRSRSCATKLRRYHPIDLQIVPAQRKCSQISLHTLDIPFSCSRHDEAEWYTRTWSIVKVKRVDRRARADGLAETGTISWGAPGRTIRRSCSI